jgi:hypothetical protein
MIHLPAELLAHIVSYTTPADIAAIYGGHIYPLKSAAILHKAHLRPDVVRYLREHPHNNLRIAHSRDLGTAIPMPMFANIRMMQLEHTKKPRQMHIPPIPRTMYNIDGDSYVSRMMHIIDSVAAATYNNMAQQLASANSILRNCDIKLGLLHNIAVADKIAAANKSIRVLKILYHYVRRDSLLCNCHCGGQYIYIPRKGIHVAVMCMYDLLSYIRTWHAVKNSHSKKVYVGRFAQSTYAHIYRTNVNYCSMVVGTHIGNNIVAGKFRSLRDYISARHMLEQHAPMPPIRTCIRAFNRME